MIHMSNVMVVVFLYNCVTANIAYVKRTDLNPRKQYATPVTRNLNRPCCLAHSPI